MPTIERNLTTWNDSYQWLQEGEEWSVSWGGAESQWYGALLPRIHAFIPAPTILEIGPGHGRWTRFLKDYCDRLVVVDLSANCLDLCKERFSSDSNITYYLNDGKSLDMIEDGSIDFLFTLDSLVHAEADVIESYLRQLRNKLTPNGIGFIHHSNIKQYKYLYLPIYKLPSKFRKALQEKSLLYRANWRSFSMSAKLFEQYCQAAGMQCIGQELINWYGSGTALIDSFSLFTPKGSAWARPNKVIKNKNFMLEAKLISQLSELYASTKFPCASHKPTRIYSAA